MKESRGHSSHSKDKLSLDKVAAYGDDDEAHYSQKKEADP